MSSPISSSQSKVYSFFAFLIVMALLLSSCERSLGFLLPTSTPISYTPQPLQAATTPTSINSTSPSPVSTTTAISPGLTTSTPLTTANTIPPSPTITASLASPTSIPPSPTATTSLTTPTVTLPSSTPQPTSTGGNTASNVVFAPGTTAAAVQGTIQPGQAVSYTLAASQSQPMILIMDSTYNDVTLGVFDPNGTILLNPANKWTSWQVTLPLSGIYTIQAIGGANTESYTLTIKVAQVVNFAPGTTATTLSGTTTNGYLFSYGLNCSAGQTMSVNLYAPSGSAYLDIFGINTGLLLSDSVKATTWTGVLPQTQDYVIEVVPSDRQEVNYLLSVSVTGTPGTSSTGGNILFAPGTTAAVNQGTVQPGQVVTYSVEASQLQPMILLVESPNHDVTLGVLYPNGATFLSPANKWNYWQWQLPETGLYTIQVIGGSTTEKYTLTTKVAQLVSFPSGSTSITLTGESTEGYVVSYAFKFIAGDVLTVTLNGDSSQAYLDIFGLLTGSLLSPSQKATTWTVTIPQTQEYVIEVIPAGGQVVNYSLTVSVP
jgi:hypothetical protein